MKIGMANYFRDRGEDGREWQSVCLKNKFLFPIQQDSKNENLHLI